jgi:hypothetical protein
MEAEMTTPNPSAPTATTLAPNGTSTDADVNPSSTIITSASLYLPLLLLGWLTFEILQRKWEGVYKARRRAEVSPTSSLAQKNYGPFGWILPVLRTSDDEIFNLCGLDTLCFLRLLRMGEKLAGFGIALSLVLFPLYATGTNPQEASRNDIDPLERITMSNLGQREGRLWASVLAMYLMSFFGMAMLWLEYKVR